MSMGQPEEIGVVNWEASIHNYVTSVLTTGGRNAAGASLDICR